MDPIQRPILFVELEVPIIGPCTLLARGLNQTLELQDSQNGTSRGVASYWLEIHRFNIWIELMRLSLS
jgi:hypothetical protein